MMSLIDTLNHISTIAKSTKFRRLLNAPFRYIKGTLFTRLVYPIHKKAILVSGQTFYKSKIKLLLPAGLDIYLLGAKTHDSEIRLSKYICNTLEPGDVFIDVGAHFGFYSLLASRLVGKGGAVISIEASLEICKVLQSNTDVHSNISCFNLACTHINSNIDFYEFPLLFSEYNTLNIDQFQDSAWFQSNPPRKISIPGSSLDSLLIEQSIRPNFIKIDVEGAEYDVIRGMKNILKSNNHLIIAMEYLNKSRGNQSHILACRLLNDYGFHSHIIDHSGHSHLISTNDIPGYLEDHALESDNLVFKHVSNTQMKSRDSNSK